MTGPKPSTYASFSEDEARAIQQQMRAGERPTCPRCKRALKSDMPVGAGHTIGPYFLLYCESCERSLFAGGGRTG